MTLTPSEPDQVVARALLEIGAVSFSPDAPFTWASGLRSPIYCDNRLTISHPSVRRRITDGFQAVIERHRLKPDVIAGTATAGIPHAAWLADRLELPLVYVRSAAKAHGRGRRTEGRLREGDVVVLVEDLVSTGMSSLDAVSALEEEGARVQAVVAIFTYDLPVSQRGFEARRLPLFALTRLDSLVDAAVETGAIARESVDRIRAWHKDPEGWSASTG